MVSGEGGSNTLP